MGSSHSYSERSASVEKNIRERLKVFPALNFSLISSIDMPAPVLLSDYDPNWIADFASLRQRLVSIVGELPVAIEHVGSTSVPGLLAKPIIDIDMTAASDEDLELLVNRLTSNGYANEGDLGIPGRIALRASDLSIPHHLYLMRQDHREFRRHILFRDYLRANPGTAKAYQAIKTEAANQFRHDRVAYTQSKSEFIESVLKKCGRQQEITFEGDHRKSTRE